MGQTDLSGRKERFYIECETEKLTEARLALKVSPTY